MDNETQTEKREVVIYSTPSCHFCHLAKDWLTHKNIPFVDYDVAKDAEKRQEMVEMTGQLGVPVIRIDEDVMIGFNPEHMADLLGVTAE